MKHIRDLRLKVVILIVVSCSLMGIFGLKNRSDNPHIEEKALFYLINVLNDSSIYHNTDLLLPLDFEEDMRFFGEGAYYSNGKLCIISEPEDIYDETIIGFSRTKLNEFLKYKDSLSQANYSPVSISLPEQVSRIDFSEFQNIGGENSYFFTIRHHLKSGKISLVEIHLTPYSKADNPFEYTFHVYFDDGKVVNWNISMEYKFEFKIDC